eukprot:8701598-Pyramimonas_sp.AAC.1
MIHLRHQGFLQTKVPEDTSCPLTTSEVDPSFGTRPSGRIKLYSTQRGYRVRRMITFGYHRQ